MGLAERAAAVALLNERSSIAQAIRIPMPKTKTLPARTENIFASIVAVVRSNSIRKGIASSDGLDESQLPWFVSNRQKELSCGNASKVSKCTKHGASRSRVCLSPRSARRYAVQQILQQNSRDLVPFAIGNQNAIRGDLPALDRFDQSLPGRFFGRLAGPRLYLKAPLPRGPVRTCLRSKS